MHKYESNTMIGCHEHESNSLTWYP